MRRLERQAAQGDEDARAQLTAERLRTGDLDRDRVKLAAHLRDPLAVQMSSGAPPGLPCSCKGLLACMRCGGTGMCPLPTDLVPFARSAEVPGDVLREWACDCAEHVLQLIPDEEDRELLSAMIARARALDTSLVEDQPIEGVPSVSPMEREPAPAVAKASNAVQLLVNASILQRRLEPPFHWRTAFAGVVTMAYRAAGNSRDERDWQRQALAGRLLG